MKLMKIREMLKISDEVIATIAQIAANEVDGIIGTGSSFAGEIKQILSKKRLPERALRLSPKNGEVTVDINVVVEYGAKKFLPFRGSFRKNVKKKTLSL
ncbi:MAG: Asp23/Gls24 family envelope stress response protein [Clostridiales bacterium]|nr:MAG: Asp23/Gls24 family envelope stress response protein [Clostridiales bacterium]